MAPAGVVESLGAAARRLGQHPHDHGWRDLYRLIAAGLAAPDPPTPDRPTSGPMAASAPALAGVLRHARAARPASSDVHLVTLLGIAVRSIAGARFGELVGGAPVAARLAVLEHLLAEHRPQVDHILSYRQNSFTGVRRFLVPQVLLAAYFAHHRSPVRFADVGTGLGILPRQLNSRPLFDRFSPELAWPDGYPAFRPVPLAARFGVDRGPWPDLAWVRECYGPSAYYETQYRELTDALARPEVRSAQVSYAELDITDHESLRRFVAEQRINAVNICYALYEIEPARRAAVVETLASALAEPGLVIVTEPHDDLTLPGCTVTVRDRASPTPRPVCAVSDGHFRGEVTPLAGYRELVARYPIRYQQPTDPTDPTEPTEPTEPAKPTGAIDAASGVHATG